MRIIIAGSRDFKNYSLVQDTIFQFCEDRDIDMDDVEIICGEARGADLLGRQFGERYGLLIQSYPADWEFYGKSAGYKRNLEMANAADALIAFNMGTKGTQHMIDIAEDMHLILKVVNIDENQQPIT